MTAHGAPGPHGDRFVLEGTLACSSIAEVFAARDRSTGARVVLKRAKSPRQANILREHRLLAQVGSACAGLVPAIVTDGLRDPLPWFAMAFIEGGNLRKAHQSLWVRDGARAQDAGARLDGASARPAALQIALQLAAALARLHSMGIVHGDLSPENVLMNVGDGLVLIDFEGASSVFPEMPARAASGRRATPGYAAPEALLDAPLDCRADLYSWACIVRELILGRPVFSGATSAGLARLHLEAPPRPAREFAPDVPAWLDTLLLELLAKDPRRRRTPACGVAWRLAEALGRHDLWRALEGLAPPPNRPGFVGRHTELRRIEARLDAASEGAGGSLVVSGPSGVGKTALLRECERVARLRGFRIVHDVTGGDASETWAALTLGVTDEPALLRALLHAWLSTRSSADDLTDSERELLQDLLPFAPQSLARLAASAAAVDLPAQAVQRRAFRALVTLARELGARQPTLAVLEELHPGDEFSGAFLAAAEARALQGTRCLIVASVGSGAAAPLALAEVAPEAIERLELGGLDRSSTAQMVNEMLGTDGDAAAFGTFLHERSEGNPLFVIEAVRLAMDKGQLRHDPQSGWSLPTPEAFDALHLATLDDALDARSSPLGPEALRVAAVAAVLGRSFLPAELIELSSDLASGLDAALLELIAHDVIAHERGRDGAYVFTHENIRRACERRLAVGDLPELHARRAQQLLQVAPRDAKLCRRVGEHWLRAGDLERALPSLLEAADQFEVSFQPFGAIDCLRTVLHHLAVDEAQSARFAGLRLELGRRLLQLYNRTGQHAHLRELAARVAEAPGEDWRAQCRALLELARSLRVTSDYAAASDRLDQAERLLRRVKRRGQHEQLWLELQEERVWLLYMNREIRAIGPALQRMAPVVRSHGTAAQQASFYMLSANDLVLRERYRFSPTAVAQEQYALSLLEGPDALPQRAMIEFDVAFLLLLGEAAHCAEAVPHLEQASALAERLSDPVLAARATTYLGIAERRLGHVAACRDAARRALEQAQLIGTRGYAGAAHACLGWVAWRRDDVAHALQCFAESQRCWWYRREGGLRSRQEFPFQWLTHLPLLAIHASRDDFVQARAAVDELLAETQQRLPGPLDELLVTLQRGWEELDARALDRLISELTLGAARMGYV
jgi:hypothetical protein